MQVLIAEDDVAVRREIVAILEAAGYEVIPVGDGVRASRILEAEGAPRIAVLGATLPRLPGGDIVRCQRNRTDAPYIYLILCSARGRRDEVVGGTDSTADAILVKPVDPADVVAQVSIAERILDYMIRIEDAAAAAPVACHAE